MNINLNEVLDYLLDNKNNHAGNPLVYKNFKLWTTFYKVGYRGSVPEDLHVIYNGDHYVKPRIECITSTVSLEYFLNEIAKG